MKKIPLVTCLFALLATSCKDAPNAPIEGEWSTTIQEEMMLYLGEVLPFADFNLTTLEAEYTELTIDDYGANGNNYCLTDDNEANVLVNYGSKLISKGFKFNKDEFDYDSYEKVTSRGKLVIYPVWYPESTILDVTAPAGNQIDAYLYFNE